MHHPRITAFSPLYFLTVFAIFNHVMTTHICTHSSCNYPNHVFPTNCLPAPTKAIIRRWDHRPTRTDTEVSINNDDNRDGELGRAAHVRREREQAREHDIPSGRMGLVKRQRRYIHGRGNPICYYLSGIHGSWLADGFATETFVLPVGRYAVKWIERYTDPESIMAVVYLKLFRQGGPRLGGNVLITHIATYGSTFLSDGISGLFLVLKHMDERPSAVRQEVEVWIQEVPH